MICKVQGKKFSEQVLVVKHCIVLFFLYEFSCDSHEQVFNEVICTQDGVYLLIFSIIIFYERDKKDIYYAYSIYPKLSQ
jgi:hypothetical protein